MRHHRTLKLGLFVVALLATPPVQAQQLASKMAGSWKIDVPASVEASKATGNEEAASLARGLPTTVECRIQLDGTFRWRKASGTWSVVKELKDGLKVEFLYQDAELKGVKRPATVKVVGDNTLHFHFDPSYPVCVYQRVRSPRK